MTTATKHPLQTAIEDAGYEVRSYSGRSMYGKRCLAVELDMHDLGRLMAGLIHATADNPDNADLLADAIEGMRSDSMGLGGIIYFPHVAAPAPEADIDYAAASVDELERLMQYGKTQHIRDAAEDELAGREAARDDLDA